MNVNVSKHFYIEGYRNISPYPIENFEIHDIRFLPVLDSECKHLILDHVLSCVHGTEVLNVLHGWVKKLRLGGKITINDVDMYLVLRDYAMGRLNEIDINTIVMGTNPFELKKGIFTLSVVKSLLQELNLEINLVRINSYEYTLEATRVN